LLFWREYCTFISAHPRPLKSNKTTFFQYNFLVINIGAILLKRSTMLLLLVNLYEFGQFLRILLWISVPMMVIAMLVTTWLHYRRKQKTEEEVAVSMEGLDLSADPAVLIAAMNRRLVLAEGEAVSAGPGLTEALPAVPGTETQSAIPETPPFTPEKPLTPEEKENMYRGILWMKEKYEQYRDLADQRIEQLKDALARAEKKYQDLLEGRTGGATDTAEAAAPDNAEAAAPGATDAAELEQRYTAALQKLEEKDRAIEVLQSEVQSQWQKTEELVVKLQNSSQLLLNISQELDKANNTSARF
jgi:hypothetical protein